MAKKPSSFPVIDVWLWMIVFLSALHLIKGQNIIRGAVINGPGMSDFCVRFIDENGKPIKGSYHEL